jgi:hypothetical protein
MFDLGQTESAGGECSADRFGVCVAGRVPRVIPDACTPAWVVGLTGGK